MGKENGTWTTAWQAFFTEVVIAVVVDMAIDLN
jgi:hypothetical protein